MFEKRMLLPHQYYYPNMNFLKERSTAEKEDKFLKKCQEKVRNRKRATIYIHVPFCNSRCAFCGFDKEYQLEEMEQYVDKLIEEMTFYSGLLREKYIIQSIHFGGGTPTLLPAKYLQKLLDKVKAAFDLAEDVAIDMEGSATTLYREEIIQFTLKNNITRVSFGIQSFDEGIRKEMNMKASKEEVFQTLDILKKNNIKAFGDILYGYPDFRLGNLIEVLKKDIETAIELGLDGVELGQMYPFKNQLEKIVQERRLTLPTDEEIIAMIELATEMLEKAGYTQTTYSGFTKNGKIILETSYFGGLEEMPDCIAMGSGAFGTIEGFKYRNASYHMYMTQPTPCYGQLKEMTKEQIENMQIVGFPKVLVLNKGLVQNPKIWERFSSKFEV